MEGQALASRCEACGTIVTCARGCYLLCTSDCLACSGGCEPSTAPPLPIRLKDGSDLLDADVVFCSNELEPGSLTIVLAGLLGRPLEPLAERTAAEVTSVRFQGSFRELLQKAGLGLTSTAS